MLIDRLQDDLKKLQLEKNELGVNTLRLLLSEIHNAEIKKGEGESLSDDEIVAVIQREVKKRKEAAEGFKQGGREDSAQKEEDEALILSKYLPEQLSDEELNSMIDAAISETNASAISDMGKVIGNVMGKVKGRAEGARISSLVKEKLSKND